MLKDKRDSLRKIAVSQLQLGMFVSELCGSWMDHPFWNTRFLLENPADLASICSSAVREVWIDTARGRSPDADPEIADGPTYTEEAERQERDLESTLGLASSPQAKVELAAEVTRAAALCGKAKTAVTAMFGEARMGRAVDAESLTPLVDEITASVVRNPGALISLARLKSQDDYTYMHSVAVCALMVALARKLGLGVDETREAGMAGLLHDLGKALVPLEILNKPGKLTDPEFDRMREHPRLGYDLLVEGRTVGAVPLDVCLHHHEKIDGSGYPDRLMSDNISLFAKMGAVCDVYDAITSDRPYKAGWDPAVSIRKMNGWSKGHYDPRIFQAFVKAIGIYPVGSLVKLESGLLGVIIEVTPESLLLPTVKTFYCTRRRTRMPAQCLDLGQGKSGDRIVGWEDPSKWNFPDLNELWSGRESARDTTSAV